MYEKIIPLKFYYNNKYDNYFRFHSEYQSWLKKYYLIGNQFKKFKRSWIVESFIWEDCNFWDAILLEHSY